MDSDRIKSLRLMNTIAFIALMVINTLADILPLGGVKTGDISRIYPNLFTPAEYTFAIWAVIYILVAGFVLYQAGLFDKGGDDSAETVRRIGGWFIASCLFNIAWIFMWHYDMIFLAVVMMLGLLITLIGLEKRTRDPHASTLKKWLVQAPFSLYFGWITVATIANVCVWLVKLRWDGFGISPEIWTAVVLLVGAVIAIAAILHDNDWVYGLAVLWAYVGILVRHIARTGLDMQYKLIIAVACVCILALLVTCIMATRRMRKRTA